MYHSLILLNVYPILGDQISSRKVNPRWSSGLSRQLKLWMRKVVGSNPGEGYYIVFLLGCWRIEWKDRMEEFNGICDLRFFEEQEEVWINLLQEELPSTIIIICWILMCIRINKGFRWPEKRIPAMGVPHKKKKISSRKSSCWMDDKSCMKYSTTFSINSPNPII